MIKNHVPVLEVESLSVAYKVRGGEVDAIQDVSFTIAPGQAFGIVGESGCGKSTVAWSIVNFLGANGYIKRGRIRFQGQELFEMPGKDLRQFLGAQIAMVYQDPLQSLNPSMRLGDQMREVLTVHQGLGVNEATERCIEMLNRVYMPDPAGVLKLYPHQISGGQQQRVVIAMALLNNPSLLIMDEPTTALDVTVEAAVLDLIDELRHDFNTAILFISHNLSVMARICDDIGVMYAGEMVEIAGIQELFSRPQHPYSQGLLRCLPQLGSNKANGILHPIRGHVPAAGNRPSGCAFVPRCDYARERCRQEKPELRRLLNGTNVRCHFAEEIDAGQWNPPADSHNSLQHSNPSREGLSQPILEVSGLTKYYPLRDGTIKDVLSIGDRRYVKALENVSFSLDRGRTLGIVGESGCGKSTLVKTIIGLERSTAGDASFMGIDISGDLGSRDLDLVSKLQMVFQNPDSTLNPSHSIGHQIGRPMERFGTVPKSQIRGEVIRLLEAVRLDASYYDRLPHQLSGGEKQRSGIARALAGRPDLILCDEPVSSLDVSIQAALMNLLLDVQREHGMTMIFVAHDLSVVRYLCDEVAVMYLGQIVEIGQTEDIFAPPCHPYTEALLSAVPVPDPNAKQHRIRLMGTVPSAIDPPAGCRFHTRCPRRVLLPDGGVICEQEEPPWQDVGQGHRISCHIPIATLREFPAVIDSPGKLS